VEGDDDEEEEEEEEEGDEEEEKGDDEEDEEKVQQIKPVITKSISSRLHDMVTSRLNAIAASFLLAYQTYPKMCFSVLFLLIVMIFLYV
jgi:hypothetical protein